jgi:hypothetical protein
MLALVLAAMPVNVWAAQKANAEKPIGTFGAWRAYTYNEGGQTVCYMVTIKTIKSVPAKKRSAPYIMITHRPIEASTDVFSYGGGMLLDSHRGVKLQIGKAGFDLFSVRDTAWARDGITDHKIAAALQAAPMAQTMAWPTKKGARRVTDTFDLKGATLAYQAIGRACGLIHAGKKKTSNKKIH